MHTRLAIRESQVYRGVRRPSVLRRFVDKPSTLGLLLCLPSFLSVVVLNIFPALWLIYIAFADVNLYQGITTFVGLGNFVSVARSEEFFSSVWLTVEYSILVVAGASVIGLLIALVLNTEFRGRGAIRSLLVIPWAIPWVVNGFLWSWILDANFGLLNGILYQLGLIKSYIVFFSPELSLPLTALAAVWIQSSFTGLICLSGLQAIPEDMYDSAEVDGAGTLQRFRHITVPWIRPTWGLATLLNAIVGLTMFDLIFIMTKGGPGTSTLLLPFLVFRQFFIALKIGEGAALSIILTLLVLCVSLVYMALLYRRARFYE